MIHPDTTLNHVDETIGDGIFATAFIPKGTIAYVIDPLDVKLSPQAFEALEGPIRDRADKYSYIDQHGRRILSWDLAKFVNHSCDPNTISTGYGFEIALRDIDEGEQITDDYGLFNLEWSVDCNCGSPRCRKTVRGTDLETHAERWDAQVKGALAQLRGVPQPLWEIMDASTRAAVEAYLDGRDEYRSVRALRRRAQDAVALADRSDYRA